VSRGRARRPGAHRHRERARGRRDRSELEEAAL